LKRIISGIMLTLLLIGMLILKFDVKPVESSGSEVLFFDDFDDGVADGWTEHLGTWSVINGEYQVSVPGIVENGMSTADSLSLTDCIIEAKVRFTDTVGFRAEIIFRYTDIEHYYTFGLSNEYDVAFLAIYSPGDTEYGEVFAHSGEDGGHGSYPTEINIDYLLRVEIQGDTFTCFINGEEVCSGTDGTYSSGKVGLRARRADVSFDNFTIYSVENVTNGPSLEEYASFHVVSEDAFPADPDLNVSVRSDFDLLCTLSDGSIFPNETKSCCINLIPQHASLTTSLDLDLGVISMTGAEKTVSVENSYLLGDSPPIAVSYGSIVITVWFHGIICSNVTIQNCSVIPSNITWQNWEERSINISTSTEPYQTLLMEIRLEYEAHFDVKVEGIGTREGQTPATREKELIQYSIETIPEFSPNVILLAVTVLATIAIIIRKKKLLKNTDTQ